jgi:hypothetical protein
MDEGAGAEQSQHWATPTPISATPSETILLEAAIGDPPCIWCGPQNVGRHLTLLDRVPTPVAIGPSMAQPSPSPTSFLRLCCSIRWLSARAAVPCNRGSTTPPQREVAGAIVW